MKLLESLKKFNDMVLKENKKLETIYNSLIKEAEDEDLDIEDTAAGDDCIGDDCEDTSKEDDVEGKKKETKK